MQKSKIWFIWFSWYWFWQW